MSGILQSITDEYRRYKALAEAALEQVPDAALVEPGPNDTNSLAVICWHVSGNLRSRFTDFLTSDGEKPWRQREEEFAARRVSRAELMAKWNQGWDVLLATLDSLTDADLTKTIRIRNEPFTVHAALHRSLAHTSYHVGQIVTLAHQIRGADWRYLSIPPGGTDAYNANPTHETPAKHAERLRGPDASGAEPSKTASPPAPVVEILEMLSAFWNSCALHVAGRLSLSDHLAHEPQSAEKLAALTETHAPSLYRFLRMLAGIGVYREREDGRFENTPLSETLRSDVPLSLRGSALHRAGSLNVLAWNDLLETVRTGKPAFARIHGKEIFDYMADHPEQAREFGQAMTSRSLIENPAIAESYDFTGIGTLVDIGGGHGSLLAEILRRTPRLKGIVFDRPEVIEVAKRDGFLRAADLRNRGGLIAGNFFDSVPKADAYIMKYILHDWDDDRCVRILSNCMRASGGKARVLVVDTVVPPGNEPHRSKSLDVHMMLVTGGKERTAEEFAGLFDRAGLRLERIVPTRSVHGIVEGFARGG